MSFSLCISFSASICICLILYFFSPSHLRGEVGGWGGGGSLSLCFLLSFKVWKSVCLSCSHLPLPKPAAAPPYPLFSTLHLPPPCLSVLISGSPSLPQPPQFPALTSALSSLPSRLHLLPASLSKSLPPSPGQPPTPHSSLPGDPLAELREPLAEARVMHRAGGCRQ